MPKMEQNVYLSVNACTAQLQVVVALAVNESVQATMISCLMLLRERDNPSKMHEKLREKGLQLLICARKYKSAETHKVK